MYRIDGSALRGSPHPAALYVANKLGADIGSVIVYGLLVGLMASLIGGPLFLKFLGQRLPLNLYPQSLPISKFAMKNTTVIRRNVIHRTAAHCADVG